MPLDPELVHALHLETLDLRGAAAEAPEHAGEAFQASTVAALMDGAYEGDLSLGELQRHGDLGLGTFDALDGELVLVDGEIFRADADGRLHRPDLVQRTPFAVVTPFKPVVEVELDGPLDDAGFQALVESLRPPGAETVALRFDGHFTRIHARSVPRQTPPYPPLVEIGAQQHVFDLTDVDATIVGFRFPRAAGGLEIAGYHLHVATADRTRGGHVLGCEPASGTLAIAPLHDLHVELPPGIELPAAPQGDGDRAALDRLEHDPD